MFAVATSNFVLIYTPIILGFGLLVVGYFLLHKANLMRSVFLLAPVSVGVSLLGEAELQLPTEPIIGLLMLLLIASTAGFAGLKNDLWKGVINSLLALEIIWLVVCTLNSELMLVSAKYTLIRICYAGVFFFLALQWMRKEKKPEQLFLLYVAGMALPIINTLMRHGALDFLPQTSYQMPKPFYNDHTVYGACLAFVIPMIGVLAFYHLRKTTSTLKKYGFLALFIVFLGVEFLSFSRAAWLSLGGALGLYMLIRWKATGATFLALLVAGGVTLFAAQDLIVEKLSATEAISSKGDVEDHFKSITNIETDASNKERINRWKCAVRMGVDRPVFGYGPRTYKYIYGRFQVREDMTYTSTFNGTKGHAHSDYLTFFAECGWVGFLLHIALFVAVVMKGLNVIRVCQHEYHRIIAIGAVMGFFTYFIHGIFNGFMEEDKMASLVFVSMAIIVYIGEQKNEESSTCTEK
jgi:putative inorganic carbon (HCO3(-)) transporter